MKDDLFERLRTVDPATDERIVQEARALVDVPGRIVDREPTNVRRFPKAIRRKATLAAVAAVVVVAIALPLTLLRSLGEGGTPGREPGRVTGSGTWLVVGPLDELRAQGGVAYLPDAHAFVLAPEGAEPYALYAVLTDDRAEREERALYCENTEQFIASRGDVFDSQGNHVEGNAERGLSSMSVLVTDGGQVQVDTSDLVLGRPNPAGPAFTGNAAECLTAAGVPLEGQPGFAIPAGSELPPIAVALPQSGAVMQSPITITGSANVFEATVSIRVLDANGDVIAQAFTTAECGTGCRGDFSTQVEVPVDTEQPGTIQVFESSARDGSMTNTVEVAVTLVPGLASGTSNVEGLWYDGDGAALPDGSPGAEGTVLVVFRGAEHCQWESAAFMHIGWPVGTVANSLSEWRQYVRDPAGLFDDGALHVGFLSDATLPPDAADTGYHRKPWALWVSPSQADDAVFVVNTETGAVERWGRSSQPILCD